MIRGMATVHMTDTEVTNNFAAVLENIRKGVEVVVEQDHRPVALIPLAACPRQVAVRVYRDG